MEEHDCTCEHCECEDDIFDSAVEVVEETVPEVVLTEDGHELTPEYVRLQELKEKRRKLRNMRKKAKQLGVDMMAGKKRGKRFVQQLFGGYWAV
jgi:hypothetical protein